MITKDLLSISQLTSEDFASLLASASEMKNGARKPLLPGVTLALLFEKPSLRTKVSFDVAASHLGGHAIYLSPAEVGLGKREPVADVARVLSRYVDIIAARTFSHETVELLAKHASVPVINALDDSEHPCQALADLLTIQEHKGRLKGVNVVYVGDGNNVAHSLMLACALGGANIALACPKGYEANPQVIKQTQKFARASGSRVTCVEDSRSVMAGADVVYTDVWTSMGQEGESEKRRVVFAKYQVNPEMLSLAAKDVIFMHPLPAHAGEEVSAGLLDRPESVVFDQAENRLHVQKALMFELLKARFDPKQ